MIKLVDFFDEIECFELSALADTNPVVKKLISVVEENCDVTAVFRLKLQQLTLKLCSDIDCIITPSGDLLPTIIKDDSKTFASLMKLVDTSPKLIQAMQIASPVKGALKKEDEDSNAPIKRSIGNKNGGQQ